MFTTMDTQSSVSVTTTAKEKTTPNFSPRPFLIGQNPSFSASPPLFKEKEVCRTTFTMSSRGNKGKKKTTFNPEIPPFHGSGAGTSSAAEATSSSSKRPRSDTTSSLPAFKPESDPLTYWKWRFQTESHKKPDASGKELIEIFSTFLADIQKDYTQRCDTLTAHIVTLAEANREVTSEITHLAEEVSNFMEEAHDDFITKVDFHHSLGPLEGDISSMQGRLSSPEWRESSALPAPPRDETPKSTFESSPPPPPPPPKSTTTQPAPTWAKVASKPRKKVTTPATKPAPAAANTQPTPKAPSTKKGLTLRERRLMIKRDGSPLTTSAIAIRDSINAALNATLIQRVECNPANHLMFTTMDTVKATSLNSKISQFLHLIPGVTTVHLDSPSAQLLVHGIPTSYPLADIGRELTTFNTGLALAQQPRWLTSDEKRVGKKASTIVITATGPKAQDFAQQSRLSAFSSTYRLERRLRFNQSTQCFNCHQFGHHTLKCTKQSTCRWCSKPHSTGDHACPTATCSTRGRLCAHSSPLCVNCGGPHEAHSTTCTKRPTLKSSEGDEVEDEVQMVGT
jgi:hypothetical protein